MKTYTILCAMEKAQKIVSLYVYMVRVPTREAAYYRHKERQYWKFRERLLHKLERFELTEARIDSILEGIMNELGVPTSDYPYPIVNAYNIANNARRHKYGYHQND